ncbi:hypothetical protein FGG08_003842 [Glutinoglossum americanum]|uniref:Uncharacterized protein n=1 Tax=Glutinoglossum americanum TaxID=1670608 RepID=A0A9P8I6U1_9PEZI|nr:hypothetical protein FGG08_003842 [Glutinoglossum americanum]
MKVTIGSFIIVGYITCLAAIVASASEDIKWLRETADDSVRLGLGPRWARPILRWLHKSWLLSYREPQRRFWRSFSTKLLTILCDTQIVTGLAIIIAAQFKARTYYDSELAIAFWNIALNSYWASRDSSLDMFANRHLWSVKARVICIWCSVVLGTHYQSSVLWQETHHWDSMGSNGQCVLMHDRSSDRSQQFWLLGLGVYSLFLLLWLFPFTNASMDRFSDGMDAWVSERQNSFGDAVEGLEKRVWTRLAPTVRILAVTLQNIFGIMWWLLKRFLSIWCVSERRHGLDVAVYTGLLAWSSYDVYDLKASNQHLVFPGTSESSLGFGQILSLALLIFIFLNILDSFTGRHPTIVQSLVVPEG